MTVYSGNEGVFKVGANAITKMLSFEVNEEESVSDRIDAMGDDWEDSIGIKYRYTLSFEVRRDASDLNGPVAMDVGDELAWSGMPDGNVASRTQLSGTARVSKIDHPVDMESGNRITVECVGKGALVKGSVSA